MEKFINNHKEYIDLICEICSIPFANIKWIKNENLVLNNEHRITKDEQCLISILTIHVCFI